MGGKGQRTGLDMSHICQGVSVYGVNYINVFMIEARNTHVPSHQLNTADVDLVSNSGIYPISYQNFGQFGLGLKFSVLRLGLLIPC